MKGCRKLTREEEQRIDAYLMSIGNMRERVLFGICRMYGLRVEEATALKVRDIKKKYMFIVSEKDSENQTFEIREDIKQQAEKLFDWYRSKGVVVTNDMPLFLSQMGFHTKTPMSRNQIAHIIRGLCNVLGIGGKVGVHSFRKGFAYDIWEKTGHNILESMKYTRHKSPSGFQCYIDTMDGTPLIAELPSFFAEHRKPGE